MTDQERNEIETTITGLESRLTGDMFSDMNIKDEIHSPRIVL